MTQPKNPEPNVIFPNEYKTSVFLKNIVSAPNIFVGDYTYYDSAEHPEDFEKTQKLHRDEPVNRLEAFLSLPLAYQPLKDSYNRFLKLQKIDKKTSKQNSMENITTFLTQISVGGKPFAENSSYEHYRAINAISLRGQRVLLAPINKSFYESDQENNKTTAVTILGLNKAKEMVKELQEDLKKCLMSLNGNTDKLEEIFDYLVRRTY